MINLSKDINRAFEVMKTPSFVEKKGLNGEIPFFIFTYEVNQEPRIEEEITGLKNRLKKEGVSVLHFNLYDIAVEILEKKGGIEKMFRLEDRKKKKPKYFLKALQSALNIREVFIPHIQKVVLETPHQMVFVSGVGAVYPYIRSHVILNNLQSVTGDVPTVMFYPGKYNGKSLSLFNKLKDDNYYRAYHLNEYQK